MGTIVDWLMEFHTARGFGSREIMLARNREARELYAALTPLESFQLAEAALAVNEDDSDCAEAVLCCLACLRPGSLAPFQDELVRRRILWPGVIYHGAGDNTVAALMPLLDEEGSCNHALAALAWIGSETVQASFARWREQSPTWASDLHVPPHRYAHEAGWELTPEGRRRDLFSRTSYPLVPPSGSEPPGGVRTGVPSPRSCGWCGQPLTVLLSVDELADILPEHGSQPVPVLTSHVCSCYGPVFSRRSEAGEPEWHPCNTRPAYLPADTADWPPFPEAPLAHSGSTRHFLTAASWLFLPDVAFSQVGGLPTWVQDAEYPTCPDCARTMPFLGQISNEDYEEYAEGIYYAFHCPECGVTATSYQQS